MLIDKDHRPDDKGRLLAQVFEIVKNGFFTALSPEDFRLPSCDCIRQEAGSRLVYQSVEDPRKYVHITVRNAPRVDTSETISDDLVAGA